MPGAKDVTYPQTMQQQSPTERAKMHSIRAHLCSSTLGGAAGGASATSGPSKKDRLKARHPDWSNFMIEMTLHHEEAEEEARAEEQREAKIRKDKNRMEQKLRAIDALTTVPTLLDRSGQTTLIDGDALAWLEVHHPEAAVRFRAVMQLARSHEVDAKTRSVEVAQDAAAQALLRKDAERTARYTDLMKEKEGIRKYYAAKQTAEFEKVLERRDAIRDATQKEHLKLLSQSRAAVEVRAQKKDQLLEGLSTARREATDAAAARTEARREEQAVLSEGERLRVAAESAQKLIDTSTRRHREIETHLQARSNEDEKVQHANEQRVAAEQQRAEATTASVAKKSKDLKAFWQAVADERNYNATTKSAKHEKVMARSREARDALIQKKLTWLEKSHLKVSDAEHRKETYLDSVRETIREREDKLNISPPRGDLEDAVMVASLKEREARFFTPRHPAERLKLMFSCAPPPPPGAAGFAGRRTQSPPALPLAPQQPPPPLQDQQPLDPLKSTPPTGDQLQGSSGKRSKPATSPLKKPPGAPLITPRAHKTGYELYDERYEAQLKKLEGYAKEVVAAVARKDAIIAGELEWRQAKLRKAEALHVKGLQTLEEKAAKNVKDTAAKRRHHEEQHAAFLRERDEQGGKVAVSSGRGGPAATSGGGGGSSTQQLQQQQSAGALLPNGSVPALGLVEEDALGGATPQKGAAATSSSAAFPPAPAATTAASPLTPSASVATVAAEGPSPRAAKRPPADDGTAKPAPKTTDPVPATTTTTNNSTERAREAGGADGDTTAGTSPGRGGAAPPPLPRVPRPPVRPIDEQLALAAQRIEEAKAAAAAARLEALRLREQRDAAAATDREQTLKERAEVAKHLGREKDLSHYRDMNEVLTKLDTKKAHLDASNAKRSAGLDSTSTQHKQQLTAQIVAVAVRRKEVDQQRVDAMLLHAARREERQATKYCLVLPR